MAETLPTLIARLIRDQFPWGTPGAPFAAPSEPDQQRRAVEEWLRWNTARFQAAVTALVARIEPILREVEVEVRQEEGEDRLVARVDLDHATKSPASILEKMARAWEARPGEAPPISFANYAQELDDLGRFRVVTNFLSDVERIAERLAAPYRTREGLSDAQRALAEEYLLRRNAFDDRVLLHPGRRDKGERCHKGIFEPKRPELSHLRVEVQIQTLLQEAWDKKDHYLLYEPRRRGEPITLVHECEMFAMSDLLYVADLTFDRLRESMLAGRRKGAPRERTGDAGT